MLWLDRRCSVVDGFQCFELVLICSGLFTIFFGGVVLLIKVVFYDLVWCFSQTDVCDLIQVVSP